MNRCDINGGWIVGGSPFFVIGSVAIMIAICLFRLDRRYKNEHAMKELVRDVRDAYQDVSNNRFSKQAKILLSLA